MQITDEHKKFIGDDGETLTVSSCHYATHEYPSVYLYVEDKEEGDFAGFGVHTIDQIKEIIEHMAKMAGLEVEFSKRFVPQYQPGDRVRSLTSDNGDKLGTVKSDTENYFGWNVAVVLDGDTDHGLYTYDELEPVTKSV